MATAVITNKKTSVGIKNAKNKRFSKVNITDVKKNKSSFSSVLPFRISITNIGIPSYSPNDPAPIGIAVIGFNNYVL